MLDDVRRFVRREGLLTPKEPVWVAVSGGVDSMVLLHVLRALGHPCSVVHIDHGLRGAESDADRDFVSRYCKEHSIEVRCLQVEPRAVAEAQGISVQMAARELRYARFGEVWQERPMPIALGHHADDAVETLLLNLMRGTGVAGWGSIAPKSGIFIRPLLAVHRDDIARYAQERGIPFREDSSNTDKKYLRNRIRHEVMPLLEQLRPGASRAMSRSVELLREIERATDGLGLKEGTAGTLANGEFRIARAAVLASASPRLFLHKLLRHLGFHPDVLTRILDALQDASTGVRYIAGTKEVFVDRDAMVVRSVRTVHPSFLIDLGPDDVESKVVNTKAGPFSWSVEPPGAPAPTSMREVMLDADRLSFPLELRPWREGDRMRPMGLGGSKLISDILVDAKVPASDKEASYVLVAGDVIIWAVGHRLAEGYRMTDASQRVLRITFSNAAGSGAGSP